MFGVSDQSNTITPEKKQLKLSEINEEDNSIKDLLSPFIDCFTMFRVQIRTPLKKQPQILESPCSTKRDLFTQLLATDNKNTSCSGFKHHLQSQLFQEGFHDSSMIRQSDEESSSCLSGMSSEENQIKKRKRKSTVQIKMLRQELNGEMNWTKDKIVHMAEVTGLSQSQVYKWCWDQKKKNTRANKDQYRLCRRKIIRKDLSSRLLRGKDEQTKQGDFYKTNGNFPSEMAHTERKISKKLIFH